MNSNLNSGILVSSIKYLGFGSPLMDMIADIKSETLNKFNLELNSTIHVESISDILLDEIRKEEKIQLIPGGCSYNTMRVLNYHLENEENTVGVLGSIGNDFYGEAYKNLIDNEKIVPLLEQINGDKSGLCLVYCNSGERGHLTNLGCSTKISEQYFEENISAIQQAELIFTELFILKHKSNLVNKLAKICSESNDKIFGFNLPSFYFLDTFQDTIIELIKHVDVMFANAQESIYLGKLIWENEDLSLSELCKRYAGFDKKNKCKPRTVIITSGPDIAYACRHDFLDKNQCISGSYLPEPVPDNEIVDTNGAGDAFAGGFLSGFVKKETLDKCMRMGHKAAAMIIKVRGCQIPNKLKN